MPRDVVDLIMDDHREFERLFAVLRTDPTKRATVTPVLTTLLFAHGRAEEAVIYPAAINEADEADEVEHSQEEHVEADELMEKLAGKDPESSEFGDILEQVIEAVTHHLEEEEETVLPGMREKMSADRLLELGEEFLAVRKELLGDQVEDVTKAQLQQQAENMNVEGASSLSKEQLKETLQEQAAEE
ncbi:hemerythrin domain-containing protein [Nocardioides houyundeii]|uniref:hemerythrin domain-containing protein n=1 Tax=Nocardioides houyundeii TaxID=2045452 RepID=UPI000C7632E4|nr:hemerythrin domain-containing protein [Nocardioides houyundeii]